NNGTCTIELPEDLLYETDLVLRIMDLQGRLVQQSVLRMHEGTVQLDIRAQAKGTYVAEVGNGKVRYTGRIVFE
ncbi:MAG: T9SS type A sorting domain-containing protein, partial [Flavobacteriales bacterium]|nr:T9SS type A sorting domain-containing protein [Flavobacteriales bacterium]